MEPAVVIALVVVLIVAAVVLGRRRRPRQDEGMHTFRRHIDALSPEARREVMDRARRHESRSSGPTADPGIGAGAHSWGRHDARPTGEDDRGGGESGDDAHDSGGGVGGGD